MKIESILIGAGLALGVTAATGDEWKYPSNIDGFGKPACNRPYAWLCDDDLRFGPLERRPNRLKRETPLSNTQEKPVSSPDKTGPKFNAMRLVALKQGRAVKPALLAECSSDMDICFKENIAAGIEITKASKACDTSFVCALPIKLDYAAFVTVSRVIKSTVKREVRG